MGVVSLSVSYGSQFVRHAVGAFTYLLSHLVGLVLISSELIISSWQVFFFLTLLIALYGFVKNASPL